MDFFWPMKKTELNIASADSGVLTNATDHNSQIPTCVQWFHFLYFFLFPDCLLHRNFYSLMWSDTVINGYILTVNSTSYPLYQKLEHSTDVCLLSQIPTSYSFLDLEYVCLTLNQFLLFILCSVELRGQFTIQWPSLSLLSKSPHWVPSAGHVLTCWRQMQSRGELQTKSSLRRVPVFLRLPLYSLL